jgi:hypothetical protein
MSINTPRARVHPKRSTRTAVVLYNGRMRTIGKSGTHSCSTPRAGVRVHDTCTWRRDKATRIMHAEQEKPKSRSTSTLSEGPRT